MLNIGELPMNETIIGNREILNNLLIVVDSARKRKRPMPHILLDGSAGCGKTTTAYYVASLLNIKMLSVIPDSIKESSDISTFCKMLMFSANKHRRYPLIFIDEVHQLPAKGQEVLGLLLENFKAPIQMGGMGQTIEVSIPPFTMLAATTDSGKLIKPFRDRFKLRFIFKEYSVEEATKIAKYHSERLEIVLPIEQAVQVAIRGRGVPRVIISHLERYRDFAVVQNKKTLNNEQFNGLYNNILKINEDGFTETDVSILKSLYKQGKPVGLENLSMIVNESPNVLKNTIEPYLIQKGLITRASKGRSLTEDGVRYLLEKNIVEDAELLHFGDLDYE
jgi:Holliday junction DNA helicase RuvB